MGEIGCARAAPIKSDIYVTYRDLSGRSPALRYTARHTILHAYAKLLAAEVRTYPEPILEARVIRRGGVCLLASSRRLYRAFGERGRS